MDRPRRARRAATLLLPVFTLLAACNDRLTEPRALDVAAPTFTILDAAHGGTAGFYFLAPMVPAPTYSGTFDGTKAPVITICVLADGTCSATMATFSGSQVRVDLSAQSYGVNWKTKDAGLDPTKTYRIQITLGATVLGYADVVVVANGSQIKTVDRTGYVALINGGVLQIRFRIETVAPPPPLGAWENGDLITYSQESWGGDPTASTAAALLLSNFGVVYPDGFVQVGISGAAGTSMIFTSAPVILAYLPANGAPFSLNNDLLDPTSSASGVFGGDVLALQLDVDFSDAGTLGGTSGLRFGDLRLCNLSNAPAYDGMTVRQFLAVMNTALGGGLTGAVDFDALHPLVQDVSAAFDGGSVSPFASQHLVNGTCP